MGKRRKRRSSVHGTDNVLGDLGFDAVGKLSTRTVLALVLNKLIVKRGLTQAQVSRLFGSHAEAVAIRDYKLSDISLDRLMCALAALGQHVEISVTQATKRDPARIACRSRATA
jgi:predicted XRE-type DNA-binding protein